MKQLSIAFSAPNINIPINYHHEVQSLIYNLLCRECTKTFRFDTLPAKSVDS